MTDDDPTLDVARYARVDGKLRAAEMCDLAGVTRRQLDHWATKGYIKPLDRNMGQPFDDGWHFGSGFPYEFTAEEAQVVVIMAKLVNSLATKPAKAEALARMIATKGVVKVGDFVICKVSA